ncbi:hypothetical protein CTI14_23195 [Methylobacterium radiotolerans]|nr:hypothetical protein CTI14_23195 [Methylobacterium radiotolerans]
MAEYITGTVIGALFVALMAGFITSLNIFDPRSACRWRCCWASSAKRSAPRSRWAVSPAWRSLASATA